MFAFLIVIHIIVCLFLIAVILLQAGRGAGLSETFGGSESIFGTKANVFLARATAVCATIFLVSCLALAVLSVRRSRSLMEQVTEEKEDIVQEGEEDVAEEEVPLPQNSPIPPP